MMLLSVLLLSLVSLSECKTVNIYVSPTGSDSNTGLDVSHPIATLDKARLLLDEPGITGNTVFVELMGGYYNLPSTLHFTHGYTQTVTFRAHNDQEVHVTGGTQIPSSKFTKVTDSQVLNIIPQVAWSKVRQVNLPDVGITNYGTITAFGSYRSHTAWLEIFINGNPGRLAQYPNELFLNIDAVPGGKNGTTFIYNTTEDSKWNAEKEPWAYGFWFWSWADDAVKISHVDANKHEITLSGPTNSGIKVGHYDPSKPPGFDEGGYFRVFNMLSELDEPGEYYLDRSTGILYIWPNTDTGSLSSTDVITVSLIDDCITMDDGVKNLVFDGFTLEACRHIGITGDNLQNITIQNMEIRNLGAYAFQLYGNTNISGSTQINVSRCDIYNTNGGVALEGGDRWTLTPAGNVIQDNHIWQFARVGAAGYNAVVISGVGHNVRFNLLHDGQYTGLLYYGNDHVIEYNHIHHMCVNCTDCGAIMADRDWTMRGNAIRYNIIHDVVRLSPGPDVRGIMFDDQVSSAIVENNVFYYNYFHINIGGGRDYIIRNNTFYNTTGDCSMQVDGRGLRGSPAEPQLYDKLKAVPYKDKIWAAKYPKLAVIDSHNPPAPMDNQIYDNVFTNEDIVQFHGTGINLTEYFNIHDNFRIRASDAATGATHKSLPQPISIDSVGPRYPTGPRYRHKGTRIRYAESKGVVVTIHRDKIQVFVSQKPTESYQKVILQFPETYWKSMDLPRH